MPPSKRLGKPKDDKMFVYTYTGTDPINNIYKTRAIESSSNLLTQTESNINNRTYSQPRTSLINATKLEYNIVNNTYQPNADMANVIFYLNLVGLNTKKISDIKIFA